MRIDRSGWDFEGKEGELWERMTRARLAAGDIWVAKGPILSIFAILKVEKGEIGRFLSRALGLRNCTERIIPMYGGLSYEVRSFCHFVRRPWRLGCSMGGVRDFAKS